MAASGFQQPQYNEALRDRQVEDPVQQLVCETLADQHRVGDTRAKACLVLAPTLNTPFSHSTATRRPERARRVSLIEIRLLLFDGTRSRITTFALITQGTSAANPRTFHSRRENFPADAARDAVFLPLGSLHGGTFFSPAALISRSHRLDVQRTPVTRAVMTIGFPGDQRNGQCASSPSAFLFPSSSGTQRDNLSPLRRLFPAPSIPPAGLTDWSLHRALFIIPGEF
ncbi:hypothetical protein FB451DRAFT_1175193 [Mycena latifolia]|nr:hypothetical protein FB451DRAFT_1175193 [Mycena latifolia]